MEWGNGNGNLLCGLRESLAVVGLIGVEMARPFDCYSVKGRGTFWVAGHREKFALAMVTR